MGRAVATHQANDGEGAVATQSALGLPFLEPLRLGRRFRVNVRFIHYYLRLKRLR